MKTSIALALMIELNPLLWKFIPKVDRDAWAYNCYSVQFLMITLGIRRTQYFPEPKPIIGTAVDFPDNAPVCACCERQTMVSSDHSGNVLCLYCGDLEAEMLRERGDTIPIEELRERYKKNPAFTRLMA